MNLFGGSFLWLRSASTVALGQLPAGHLAARPRAARRSPRVGAAQGLLKSAMPPGHAVGAWLAAGALGHVGGHSAQTSPVSPPSERPQPFPLPVWSLARVASFRGLTRHRRELDRPEVARPHPLLTGLNRDHFIRRADLGRSASTRARWMRAAAAERGRKKSGPSAHVPVRTLALCALSSAFVEAWPR